MTQIVQIGNQRHDFCTEVHLCRDLKALGHEVEFMQEPPGGTGGEAFLDEVSKAVTRTGARLVLYTRTWGLGPAATDLWRYLEGDGVTTASYHLDLYVPLPRRQSIEGDSFWTTQHVFTADGDPKSQAWFEEHGINHHWMPPGVVSDECYPGSWRERYDDYDVVFVGSGPNYHPEWAWRRELLAWLEETYGPRFRRFGGDQPEGPTRGADLNDLYATARVVVGDTLTLPGSTRYTSDRVFETVGRGGFLLYPRLPFLTDDLGLVDREHLAFYDIGDFDGLRQRIDHYAMWPDRAREIALNGQAFVRENHTYQHRLHEALATMGFDSPRKPLENQQPPSMFSREFEAVISRGVVVERREYVQGPIRLEIGSGYNPTPGFVHLDLNPEATDVDIVGPAWPLDLPDGSVSEIRAVDVVEHDHYSNTDAMLAEFARVMIPGGRAYIQVPDAAAIFEWYVNEPERLVERIPPNLPQDPMTGACWRLFGGGVDGTYAKEGDDWRLNLHAAAFSRESLTLALDRAGFDVESIETNGHPNLLCRAVRR